MVEVDILGMDETTLQELKKKLDAEQGLLVEELKTIADPDPNIPGEWNARFPKFEAVETNSSSDQEVEQDEIEEYEARLSEEHTFESRLLEVSKALERMKNKTYGICTACKKPIPLERLRANPAAEYDIEHAQ